MINKINLTEENLRIKDHTVDLDFWKKPKISRELILEKRKIEFNKLSNIEKPENVDEKIIQAIMKLEKNSDHCEKCFCDGYGEYDFEVIWIEIPKKEDKLPSYHYAWQCLRCGEIIRVGCFGPYFLELINN